MAPSVFRFTASPIHPALDRVRAAVVHLLLSCLVAALAAAVVLGVWYPGPFRQVSGGRDLFVLMISVDLVLGPLITLAIFNRQKPRRELRRDLAVVALMQLVGLAYGLHTVWQARPVYLVFEVDRFRVVRAIDLKGIDLIQAPGALRGLPAWGPKTIAAIPPSLPEAASQSIRLAFAGQDIYLQPGTWQPYGVAKAAVLSRAHPVAKLQREQPAHSAEVDALARKLTAPVEGLAYLPLIARQTDWVVVVDNRTADIVGYLPFGGF